MESSLEKCRPLTFLDDEYDTDVYEPLGICPDLLLDCSPEERISFFSVRTEGMVGVRGGMNPLNFAG